MPAPIVQWWKGDNSAQLLQWDAGIVDADTYSPELEVLVWNNKGGATDVSDMTNVFITTKNTDGTDTGPVATKSSAIVEVQTHDGAVWSAWTEVGGSANTVQLVNGNGEVAKIYGTANNGDSATAASKKNYARAKLRLHVLPTAPAGPINWKTRVSYQYV